MKRAHKHIVEAFKQGYTVEVTTGKVFGLKGQELCGSVNKDGYRLVFPSLQIDGKRVDASCYVHRMIAYRLYGEEVFKSGIEVRHLDGNPSNNKGSNLLLGTRYDNTMDMTFEQRSARNRGKVSKKRLLNLAQVAEVRKAYSRGIKRGECKALAEKFNTNTSTISEIGLKKSYVN